MQNMSRGRLNEVKVVLINRMFSQAPGVYTLLRGLARRVESKDPVDIFLSNPRKLYNLLMEHYGDRFTAVFVFRNLFVKPLAEYLGLFDKVDELSKASIEGCEELLKVIHSLKPAVRFDEVGLCAMGDETISMRGGGGGRQVDYLIPSRMSFGMIEEF